MKKLSFLILVLGLLVSQTSFARRLTVTDGGDATANDGVCTLREAIIAANSDTTSGASGECIAGSGTDTIVFASSVTTVCLTDTANGDLDITSSMSIIGNAVNGTIIDGRDTTAGGTTTCTSTLPSLGDRIFDVSGSSITVSFENLTIKNGNDPSGFGEGIYVNADVSSWLTLTISNSTISGNSGVGIYNQLATLTINNSTISGNSGTGIYNQLGTLTVNNSTISENTSSGESGGGIYSDSILILINSTISGNTVSEYGGGLFSTGPTSIKNTIIAENAATTGPDCYGTLSSYGYNLIEDDADCTLNYATSGLTAETSFDTTDTLAYLSDLADNGGNTFTQALSSHSLAAIDQGDCSGITGVTGSAVTTDQRGETRGTLCDIGAYEYQSTCGNSVIDTGEECDAGDTVNGDGCSLTCLIETLWYYDDDGDGYGGDGSNGSAIVSIYALNQPILYAANATDCDEDNASINPGVTEILNDGIDQDCSGADATSTCGDGVTEGDEECDDGGIVGSDGCSDDCREETKWYPDRDADGYGDDDPTIFTWVVDPPSEGAGNFSDCNDNNSSIHPEATETCGDGIDNDCDDLDESCADDANLDDDADGVLDTDDNCPLLSNADQLNTDGDTQGNVCDSDDDGDGVADSVDDLPLDATESVDTDGDGVGDNSDAFPTNATESADADGDGSGDVADTDDDKDGALDTVDDSDGDGIVDAEDEQPTVANTPATSDNPAANGGNGGGGCSLTDSAQRSSFTAIGLIWFLSLAMLIWYRARYQTDNFI